MKMKCEIEKLDSKEDEEEQCNFPAYYEVIVRTIDRTIDRTIEYNKKICYQHHARLQIKYD